MEPAAAEEPRGGAGCPAGLVDVAVAVIAAEAVYALATLRHVGGASVAEPEKTSGGVLVARCGSRGPARICRFFFFQFCGCSHV